MIKLTKPFRHAVSSWSRRATALALVLLLVQAPQILAQAAAISASQAATPMALHIVILDGENALNNIRQRSAREPIVQVEDENHKPVAAAAVLFTIHAGASGAGGSFSGASTFSAVTGLDGQAVGKGLLPNSVQGTFSIILTATIGTVTTSTVISMSNILGSFSPSVKTKPAQTTSSTVSHVGIHIFTKNFWVVAGGVGAATAAVVTAAVLTHSNGATITPGGGTVKP